MAPFKQIWSRVGGIVYKCRNRRLVIEPVNTAQLCMQHGCNQTALIIATGRLVPEAINSRRLLAHI